MRRDVGDYLVYYLQENQDRFPGIEVQRVFVRDYPEGTLAAHILGNVGEIGEEELKEARYRGLQPGDEIGQDGVEDTYDRFLRGQPGLTRIQVDAMGQPTPNGRLVSQSPVPGRSLKLSIDGDVQAAGEAGLAAYGSGGFVTMDVHSGEILGLGSSPSFEPSDPAAEPEAGRRDLSKPRRSPGRPSDQRPLPNRLHLQVDHRSGGSRRRCDQPHRRDRRQRLDHGRRPGLPERRRRGAGAGRHGARPRSLLRRLLLLLGWKMWNTGGLQRWAHKLGIARPSGIDLPSAEEELLPTQKWRNELFKEGGTDRPWSAGDNIQLATGQGDLQTNPLQMAIAYATLGNGGTVVTPHVGKEITDAAGRVLKEFAPPPQRHVRIDPAYRQVILAGLHGAAQSPDGTSYEVFGNFPVPVAGKTGTAQRVGHADQSWYLILAPYPNPKIVTAVTIEEGGFGAEAAAPVALDILEAYFNKHTTGSAGPNGGSPG